MAIERGMEFFEARRRHPAGWTAQLRSLRNTLTDLLLVPPDAKSPLRLLGMDARPPAGKASGVAVRCVAADAPPELVIFTATERQEVEAFVRPLRQAGVVLQVVPNISFKAAARPVQGGQSLGHGSMGGAGGTMGCVVQSRTSGDKYALTCNHVIADLNGAARMVTEVWEPASGWAGSSRLGLVADYADIDFYPGASNVIDAALALPDSPADIDAAVRHIGRLSSINVIGFGAAVKKSGAATGLRDGTYQYELDAMITYSNGSTALFRDMLGIVGASRNFAAQGDSGAVVVDDGNAAVGMVVSVASGIDLTMATPIKPVLDYFNVDLV